MNFKMHGKSFLAIFLFALLGHLSFAEEDSVNQAWADAASAVPDGDVHFFESFREGWSSHWVNSTDAKYSGEWHWVGDYSEIPGDYGLQMSSGGKLHAIAAPIKGGVTVKDTTLVVQYELKAAHGLSCDGGYLKLLQEDAAHDLAKFDNDARYTIMFGPDRCGTTDKVHFILQHRNPVTKKWEEKHAEGMPSASAGDRMTHLYTLVIRPDNSFEVFIDLESKKKGSLLQDMQPVINPPKEIDDPSDSKPKDWVDEEMMDDPAAKKPDDWDETLPEMIEDMDAKKPSGWLDDEPDTVPDPKAKKPTDWDDEEDGEWEAPIVPNAKCEAAGCGEWKRPKKRNPDYKGKWYAPKIKNPAYKGQWSPRKIPNPDWFEDLHPHNVYPISAVGFELLTNSGGIVMDNVLITPSEEVAKSFALKTWAVRNKAEKAKKESSSGYMDFFRKYTTSAREFYEDSPFVALSILGVVLISIIVLIFACCVGFGGSKAPKAASESRKKAVEERKKKDESEPDDVTAADSAATAADQQDTPTGDGEGASAGKPKKKSSRKAD